MFSCSGWSVLRWLARRLLWPVNARIDGTGDHIGWEKWVTCATVSRDFTMLGAAPATARVHSHFGPSYAGYCGCPEGPRVIVVSIMSDVVALLAVTHGRCLRAICDSRDAHAAGLQSAARPLRGRIPAWVSRRLTQLDVAFAVNRHATKASCDSLVVALQAALDDLDGPVVQATLCIQMLLILIPPKFVSDTLRVASLQVRVMSSVS